MVKLILTGIPVKCGFVDPYVDRFFDGFWLSQVLPPYNGKVVRVETVS